MAVIADMAVLFRTKLETTATTGYDGYSLYIYIVSYSNR